MYSGILLIKQRTDHNATDQAERNGQEVGKDLSNLGWWRWFRGKNAAKPAALGWTQLVHWHVVPHPVARHSNVRLRSISLQEKGK